MNEYVQYYQQSKEKLYLPIYISVYSYNCYLSRCMYTYMCKYMITESSNKTEEQSNFNFNDIINNKTFKSHIHSRLDHNFII